MKPECREAPAQHPLRGRRRCDPLVGGGQPHGQAERFRLVTANVKALAIDRLRGALELATREHAQALALQETRHRDAHMAWAY